MARSIVECVPNFSEGRDQATLDALRAAITHVAGVRLLDVEADTSHNRAVCTLGAPPAAAAAAAFRAIRGAKERIDLTRHAGEHPRMGATDVVPFIPVRDVTMDECVALAQALAERVGRELAIPVYLYAKAAARPERERLPDIRKGEFEGLRQRIGKDPAADPDYGPKRIHPTAGPTVIGTAATSLKCLDIADHILEAKIREGEGPTLDGWIAELAGAAPVPGGGSAAALAGTLAAALVAMVARLTIGRKAYAAVESRARAILAEAETLLAELRRLVDDDAAAYARVSEAYKIPKDDPRRIAAIDAALVGAAETPLEMARRGGRLLALAPQVRSDGHKHTR